MERHVIGMMRLAIKHSLEMSYCIDHEVKLYSTPYDEETGFSNVVFKLPMRQFGEKAEGMYEVIMGNLHGMWMHVEFCKDTNCILVRPPAQQWYILKEYVEAIEHKDEED